MATRESNILFDDIFTVQDVDLEGKKFERGKAHTGARFDLV